ncbi:hypothetical protein KEM56_005001 [Ascosphaera pollenicola]|nr:hypothetical protein KEM56_005001 [Ascosphaera pollenicola]
MTATASSPWPLDGGDFNGASVHETGETDATSGISQREPGLCARCWAADGTSILYNSPVCDECFRQAKEKRVGYSLTGLSKQEADEELIQGPIKGTKVCGHASRLLESMVAKMILAIVGSHVAADADPRPRRGKKLELRTSVLPNSPSPSPTTNEAEECGSGMDDTPKQECSRSPRRQSAIQAQRRMDDMMEACLSPPSSFTSLLEVVNSELEKESPQHAQQQVEFEMKPMPESDNENLPLAIQDSYNLVHAREMARAVSEIQDKIAEINDTVQILKLRLDGWMRKCPYGGKEAPPLGVRDIAPSRVKTRR